NLLARSGARRPSRRYGKSKRATGSGANPASSASSEGCSEELPAPGHRASASAVTFRPTSSSAASAEQDPARLGELGDALRRALALGAGAGGGVAQVVADRPLHGPPRRHGTSLAEVERVHRPGDRVAHRAERDPPGTTGQVRDQRRVV